ncbi:ExeM/NucH family extracellular endonuclease [Microbacterium candidum]|uniref:ExeM/NucH family extracellular endonuclease n=1 Tax=Microbacterium candidum TaxID=3041922 RepID=A0ABT7MYW5_9MICO|nr:ExeM/NucH family extracellular endonuclease [Microbacterium sp. ASV49]MDL9979641.1 ExeM/NucH family extracellular endonuclease [Microbacterium sp. ASV49]
MPSIHKRRVAVAAAAATAACLLGAGLSAPAFANTAGTDLVISEVYLNGGSASASYTNKFVELYNPTSSAISLAGDTLQYRSAGNTAPPNAAQIFGLSGSVPAHGHFLIQLTSNGTNGLPLPAPDLTASGGVNPSGTSGTFYLAASTTPVAPTDASIIDKVGWGTGASPEGTAVTGNSVTLSYQRTAAGLDTDNNAADFTKLAPTPEGSGSSTTPPDGGDPIPLTIAQIQGATDTSPYAGKTVTTEGVVTADYRTGGYNGFYLETGGAGGAVDATPGESDAVFVYGSISAGQVEIGDSVTVTGKVEEYQGTTEITSPKVAKLATPLPAVTPAALTWDDLKSEAQKEAHEGELIAPLGDFTVADNYNANFYGSFTLAAGTTPLRQPTDAGTPGSAEAKAVVADNAARMITLDDGANVNYSQGANTATALPWLSDANPVRIGSSVTFRGPVVLEYRNSVWNFQPTAQVQDDGAAVVAFGDTRAPNERPATTGGDARLATFNVQNYFPTTGEKFVGAGLGTCTWYTDRAGVRITVKSCTTKDGKPGPRGAADDASFQRQQEKIVTGINRLGASIVSLEEVENSVKFGHDRDTALAGLVDALNKAAGSPTWAYAPSPAESALPPLTQQDVIRTAFIYKPAEVALVGASKVLADQSGPGQPFSIARQPLAQGFKRANATDADVFVVVANHWKSKGSGNPLYPGDEQDTSSPALDQGAFNMTRVKEAQATVAFADSVAAGLHTERIVLLGDFNAYTHEDPMTELYKAGYTDLATAFDEGEHTYSYNGLQGSLDHVLANPAALKMVTGADIWQINAQESVAFNYSRFNYNVTRLFDGGEPFAASDHNPEVVGLNLPAPAAWAAGTAYVAGDLVTYKGSIWRAQFYTKGEVPGASKKVVWAQLATAGDGSVEWTATRIFNTGDVVDYNGVKYVAQWWTQGDVPGAAAKKQPWKPIS